jgi:hypothetical protein
VAAAAPRAKDFAALRGISELGPFPTNLPSERSLGRLAPRTLHEGSRLIFHLRKFGAKLRRALQPVLAASRVYGSELVFRVLSSGSGLCSYRA